MYEKIGALAGEVWHFLKENGESSFAKIKDAVAKDQKMSMKPVMVGLALGWLAREGQLDFIEDGEGKRYRLTINLK